MMKPSVFTWRNRRPQILILVAGCVGLLGSIGLLTLLAGTPNLSSSDLWVIANGGGAPLARIVVTQLRLPRLVLRILAVAMFAFGGRLLQDALPNALAAP